MCVLPLMRAPPGLFCLLVALSIPAAARASCPLGQYTDGVGCAACPAHTVAGAGAVSVHDCRCEAGFLCMYYHQVHATVTLNTTLQDFENDHGGVRSGLLTGVATAAGVVPSQVHIHYVVIRLDHRRRLLSPTQAAVRKKRLQVSLVVSGTSTKSLVGLRLHLSSLQTPDDSWEVRRRVLVLAIPSGAQRVVLPPIIAGDGVAVEQNA
jgi:hypothetical protein